MKRQAKNIMIKPLTFIGLMTAFIMTSYESIKHLILGEENILESHTITVIFTTILAVIVSYFALRKYYAVLKILGEYIPICLNCKKLRDNNNTWLEVEDYIKSHTYSKFTHGICPECGIKYMKEINKVHGHDN